MGSATRKIKILKIVQAVVFAVAWIIIAAGFISLLGNGDEEGKAVALIFFLVLFWGISGGIGNGICFVLGAVGLAFAIKEKKAQNEQAKKDIIYFAISLAVVLILYFGMYAVCAFVV